MTNYEIAFWVWVVVAALSFIGIFAYCVLAGSDEEDDALRDQEWAEDERAHRGRR